jgi:hypothetical protein
MPNEPKKKGIVATTKHIEDRSGLLMVSRTYPNGKPADVKETKIAIRPFVTNPANVSVKLGATIPTEAYANVRMDVMISCPCYVEEIVPVFNELKALVETLAEQLATSIAQEVNSTANESNPSSSKKGEGLSLEDIV